MSVSVQVYVRRAYTAYEVISVQQEELATDVTIVEWQFLLPQSHPNRLHNNKYYSEALEFVHVLHK